MMSLILFLVGCTNSGLDRESLATGETGSTDGGGDKENCPFVGRWELKEIQCSSLPFDSWGNSFEGASMKIDHDPDGGCKVVTTLKGSDCEQEEEWHFSKPSGVEVEVTFEGVSDCQPTECQFEDIGTCEDGANQGQDTASIEEVEGELKATVLLANTAESCPLTVNTIWEKR